MTRPSPYFMHDQMRHRVAHLMQSRARRPGTTAAPLWPLIVVIAALTFLNFMSAIPQL